MQTMIWDLPFRDTILTCVPFLDDFQQLAIILAKTVRRIVNIEIKYQTIHATRTMRTDTQEHGSLIIVNVLPIQGKIREF